MKQLTAIALACFTLSSASFADITPSEQAGFLSRLAAQPRSAPWALEARRSSAKECCKICTKGQACGDTCISMDKTCHVGPGCACNG